MASADRSRYQEAARLAKRGIPIALDLYRRWQALPPETRERYLRQAREYAKKAGDMYAERRSQGFSGGAKKKPRRRRST
jgi:hypothetical protein